VQVGHAGPLEEPQLAERVATGREQGVAVVDDRDALFTPCRYALGELRFLEGTRVADLHEVVSFRGRFADQARSGQWVRAYGAVERVVWRERRETTRLVVGGRPGDYLLGLEGD